MIRIRLTKEEIEKADKFTEDYKSKGKGVGFLNVSKEQLMENIRKSKLTELAFKKIMDLYKIEIECSDILEIYKKIKSEPDFILKHSKQTIDIKAAINSNHQKLVVNKQQTDKHLYDIYIGCKYISDERIDFYGYIKGKDLINLKINNLGVGDCRFINLVDLNPIEQLIDKCRDKLII